MTEEYSSITKQTHWPCHILNFGHAANDRTSFFNCGLIKRSDGLWLVARRSRNMKGIRFGLNDLMAFQLDRNYQPIRGIPIQFQRRFPDEQWEDPRVFYHKNRLYVSFCNFVWTDKGWTGAHQAVAQLDDGWHPVRRHDPVYGNNGSGIGQNSGHEKNWVFFSHNDKLYVVYQSSPHTVVELSDDFFKTNVTIKDNRLKWKYGFIRGGTPPIFHDGLYWTFFHSSVAIDKPFIRRYYMGAYAFDPNTFEIVRITKQPLLAGSEKDLWRQGKPLVVFPCGAVLDNNKWIISMGVNDLQSAIIRISHEDIYKSTSPVKFAFKNLVDTKYRFERKTVEVVSERLQLKDVTLVCADTRRPDLAEHAFKECQRRVDFGDAKFFTDKGSKLRQVVKIAALHNLEDYCRFMVKDLNSHIKTSHCLVVQWDGYILNEKSWSNEFLRFDYIGSPWPDRVVGNGGFSLRSKKLLETLKEPHFKGLFSPEDVYIGRTHRRDLEARGIRFAPLEIASTFAAEIEPYNHQFGFHSFITPVPDYVTRPLVFNHSGDWGDIIYSMAAIKARGGGILVLSPNHSAKTRQIMDEKALENIRPLLEIQDYIFQTKWFGARPSHTDFDLNQFRSNYVRDESLFSQFLRVCAADWPSDKPWLAVDMPVFIAERDVVVSRSLRYHNNKFGWQRIVNKLKDRMVFVGTEIEHQDFVSRFGYVPHFKTQNLLELARVIQGSRVFIGNQSCPMAIAMGLGVNLIQEVWTGDDISLGDLSVPWDGKGDANCRLNRESAVYVTNGELKEIPFI